MVTTGLLVRLEARAGSEDEVEEFLRSALPLVRDEPATTAWFAVRFARSEYGIFDVFPDEAGREAHLSGPVARALMDRAGELFSRPPDIQVADVLADKLPAPAASPDPVTKGLLLTLGAKEGREADVEEFLRDAEPLVQEEPQTTAWFALRLGSSRYAIFDVFPDNGGRFHHLVGRVPRSLARNALSLLASVPDMDMLNVLADKLPSSGGSGPGG